MRRIITVVLGCLLVVPMLFAANASARTATVSAHPDAGPTAGQIIDKLGACQQISNGKYATDDGGDATVPICQTDGVVSYTADMDIDCDGQRTAQCNENTDCCFQDDTAYHTSDDQPLDAANLPYVVMPSPSSTWDFGQSGIDGGSVVAVIYNNKVEYAVVGDTGPENIIGESSYATANDLGIDPDPSTGGTDGPVTYVVFPHSKVDPIESHDNAVSLGEQLAQSFVDGN